MRLLYDLLQIPPCSKWNIFKRVKTYFAVRKIKKLIVEDISDWSSFFTNIVDYCTFMEHVKANFQIPRSENYTCNMAIYNSIVPEYTYILRFNTVYTERDTNVTIIYKTDETDRLNVRMKINDGHSEYGYDVYLESDKLESYKHDDLKNDIILFTIEYMKTEIIKALDSIVNKYIFQRKEKANEDEKEKI